MKRPRKSFTCRAGRSILLLVALVVLVGPAVTEPSPFDPEDVAALLADLEAHGGILDEQDLALLEQALEEPAPRPAAVARGLWTTAVDWRQPAAGPRYDTRLRRDDQRLRLAARWRVDGADDQVMAWLQGGGGFWRVTGGAGSLGHGSGLLSAPLGARSSLGIDTSLLPAAPGWRPSLAATMPQRLQGLNVGIERGRLGLQVGAARDLSGQRAQHLRLGLQHGQGGWAGPGIAMGLLGLRRGASRAAGLDLRWGQGPWRLAAEAGLWRLDSEQAASRAWVLAARWRQRRWTAEFQAAGSRASGAMPGAQRPACLPGWQASGWAWRLSGRPSAGLRLRLAGAAGDDRDPRRAAGRLRTTHLLVLSVAGSWLEQGTWELRWRRHDEVVRNWDPQQSWLPAQEDRRRARTWWVLQTRHPAAAGGALQFECRRLEEAGRARNLLGIRFQSSSTAIRYRVGWQTAWGDPLDLVTVSAPVSSLLRLRHWGSWKSGLLLGCEGGGRSRWRWQLGGELRRRTEAAGGDLVGEGRLLWGRSF